MAACIVGDEVGRLALENDIAAIVRDRGTHGVAADGQIAAAVDADDLDLVGREIYEEDVHVAVRIIEEQIGRRCRVRDHKETSQVGLM